MAGGWQCQAAVGEGDVHFHARSMHPHAGGTKAFGARRELP
jgi:hypothetical protein